MMLRKDDGNKTGNVLSFASKYLKGILLKHVKLKPTILELKSTLVILKYFVNIY